MDHDLLNIPEIIEQNVISSEPQIEKNCSSPELIFLENKVSKLRQH